MSDTEKPTRRAIYVHAHPDDESSQTSLAMARGIQRGEGVTLVTSTLGEKGEILPDDLKYLADNGGLAEHRLGELTRAMAELGVTDFVRLGGDGKYQDSGMSYAEDGSVIPADDMTDASFAQTNLLAPTLDLVKIIRNRRPQVLVTYNPNGGYGHPDHIQAHRVAMYATQLAAAPGYRPDLGEPWQIDRIYWSEMTQSQARKMAELAKKRGEDFWFDADDFPPFIVPDEDISVWIKAPDLYPRKIAALRAHRSQVDLDTGFFADWTQSEMADQAEAYRLVSGTEPTDATDLFSGLKDE